MEQPIHLATPAPDGDVRHTACGAPWDMTRWTTSPEIATCLVCRLRWALAVEAHLAHGEHRYDASASGP